jgi:hypothetical protein
LTCAQGGLPAGGYRGRELPAGRGPTVAAAPPCGPGVARGARDMGAHVWLSGRFRPTDLPTFRLTTKEWTRSAESVTLLGVDTEAVTYNTVVYGGLTYRELLMDEANARAAYRAQPGEDTLTAYNVLTRALRRYRLAD